MSNLYESIKDIALLHKNVNSFGSSDIFKLNDMKDIQYPIIWVELQTTDLNYTQINPTIRIYYVDRILDDLSDSMQIELDSNQILNDLIYSISNYYQILDKTTVTPFNQKFFDMCAGGYLDIQLSECADGLGMTSIIEASTPNLLPSEYVEYSGQTLESYLDNLNVDSSLNSKISTETSQRISVDSSLSTVLSTETGARTSADTSLESAISGANTSIVTALSTEISTRTSADTSIVTALSSEVSTRTSETTSLSTALSTSISSEASVRASADSSLESVISGANSSLVSALSTEVSVRTSADSSLSTALSSEVSTRTSADSSLSTVLSTETSQRISVDSSLNNIISTEISTRISADSSLEIKINSINQSIILRLMV